MAPSSVWLVFITWTIISSCKCNYLTEEQGDMIQDLIAFYSVVTPLTACSVTCGLGVRIEKVCPLDIDEEIDHCTNRTVPCSETTHCGMKTREAAAGGRLELDCLEEMEDLSRVPFLVYWRFAQGAITAVDSLFRRKESLSHKKLVLDPVEEVDSGTYRCDVLDANRIRVKRLFIGVKVTSPDVLSLDFEEGLRGWDSDSADNTTTGHYPSSRVRNMVLISVSVSVAVAAFCCLLLWCYSKRLEKRNTLFTLESHVERNQNV